MLTFVSDSIIFLSFFSLFITCDYIIHSFVFLIFYIYSLCTRRSASRLTRTIILILSPKWESLSQRQSPRLPIFFLNFISAVFPGWHTAAQHVQRQQTKYVPRIRELCTDNNNSYYLLLLPRPRPNDQPTNRYGIFSMHLTHLSRCDGIAPRERNSTFYFTSYGVRNSLANRSHNKTWNWNR